MVLMTDGWGCRFSRRDAGVPGAFICGGSRCTQMKASDECARVVKLVTMATFHREGRTGPGMRRGGMLSNLILVVVLNPQ
jgi:hypothetical protein